MNLQELIKTVQREVGVEPDGDPREKTWEAIAKRLGVTQPAPTPTDESLETPLIKVDQRSLLNVATLLSNVQPLARAFLTHLNATLTGGRVAKIISGTRSYEEQNRLYNQGRVTSDPIVTNARAGYSNHNFGIAWDIGIFDLNGKYIEDGPEYDVAGEVGKGMGLHWGGDWTFQDKPHFEWHPPWAEDLTESLMLAELRQRKERGESIA